MTDPEIDESTLVTLGEIKRLHLQPGDAIVLEVKQDLNVGAGHRLRELLRAKFPGHEVVVLAGEAELKVVSPSAAGDVPDNSPEAVLERYRAAGGLS